MEGIGLNILLISNIITSVCALIGFVYGFVKYMNSDTPIFAKMITMAPGCMVFGGLYQIIRIWVGRGITEEFQLGFLAFIGSLLFLLSASFGSIDKAVDNRSRELRKYRLIPLIAPAAIAAAYGVIAALFEVTVLNKVTGSLVSVFAMLLSYISLKHLILPADDAGLVKDLKYYNILTLIYSLSCVAQMIVLTAGSEVIALIVGIIVGIVLLLLVPSVGKGVKKWTTI